MQSNQKLDEWLEVNLSYKLPKKGLQIFNDPNIIYYDKLVALYHFGRESRTAEVERLNLENSVLNKQLSRTQEFKFTIPWWIGLIILTIAAAYFYFNFIYK